MNILVLNASPKGNSSITLQTSLYLEKRFPLCNFTYQFIGCSRKANEAKLSATLDLISKADITIFSFPVYTFACPSQLHYFVRLLKEKNLTFKGKVATALTTSKHFYDVTAHTYIEENLLDLGFNYLEGLSLDMEDLLNKEGQNTIISWFDHMLWAYENQVYTIPPQPKTQEQLPTIQEVATEIAHKDDYTVSLVVDYNQGKKRLQTMVNNFVKQFPYKVNVVDLSTFNFKGGCLGCLKCAIDGKCVYTDGFNDFYENQVLSGDAIIYAFTIVDHSMGPLFKTFDDRCFYNGHRTVSQYKPTAFLVNGNLDKEANLKLMLTARADVGRNYLSGIATNEFELTNTAKNLAYALEHKYVKPRTFYGVGGMKIFRDLIWIMQGIMKDDHKFYKENGFYDFPQKQRGIMIALKLVGSLMRNKKIMKKGKSMMEEGMLGPYKKVLEQ